LHQLQQQESEQQVEPERQQQENVQQHQLPQPIASESQLTEPEPLQLQQAERTDSSQQGVAVESSPEQLEPQQLQQQQQQLATVQHFSIGTVAEDSNFDIASEDSEEADSIASPVEADPDDAFWWSELHASDAQGLQHIGDQQPHSPSDEGGRPAKRHRPG